MARKLLIVMIAVGLSLSLGACGRKNAPDRPDDGDPKYPRAYPQPTPLPSTPEKTSKVGPYSYQPAYSPRPAQ